MEIDIFKENIAYMARWEAGLIAMREAQYAQIARECRNDIAAQDVADLYRALQPEMPVFSVDFARFCKHYSKKCKATFAEIDDVPSEEMEKGTEGRTAYMQNSYTDRAWRQFAKHMLLRAEYYTGYPAVCEEVYYGRSRYCILPLYTSSDGLLISFRKLLSKYDLQICMETQVEMADESVMRFGLLRRGLTLMPGGRRPKKMDITVTLPEKSHMGVLFSVCVALDIAVTAVHTVPLNYGEVMPPEYGDESHRFCLELGIERADLGALSLFLEGAQIRYTVEGLYITV